MKKVKRIYIIVLTLFSCAMVCLVTVTYGWFMQEAETVVDYKVDAVGYIVMEFDASTEQFSGTLTPAIAQNGAIANNLIDATRTYKDGEALPQFIVSGAKPLNYSTTLNYIDASTEAGSELEQPFVIAYQVHTKHDAGSKDYMVVGSGEIEISVAITINGVTKNVLSGDVFSVKGDTKIMVAVTMYLRAVDELMDPKILNDGIMLLLSISNGKKV